MSFWARLEDIAKRMSSDALGFPVLIERPQPEMDVSTLPPVSMVSEWLEKERARELANAKETVRRLTQQEVL